MHIQRTFCKTEKRARGRSSNKYIETNSTSCIIDARKARNINRLRFTVSERPTLSRPPSSPSASDLYGGEGIAQTFYGACAREKGR